MPLESQAHTSTVHKFGHDSIGKLSVQDFPPAKCDEERPQIPSPSLFDFNEEPARGENAGGATNSDNGSDQFVRLPTVAECAAHLELLEVFYVTRQKILGSLKIDDSMNIHPRRVTKVGKKGDKKTLKDDTFWDRRQEKWHKYLEFATVRFLAWKNGLTDDDIVSRGPGPRVPKHLPPLDILMVWHSFLLNPRLFYEKCGKERIWRLRMPWDEIHSAIDSDDWSFKNTSASTAAYRTKAGLSCDLFHTFENWGHPTKDSTYPKTRLLLTDFSLAGASSIRSDYEPASTSLTEQQTNLINIFRSADVSLARTLKQAVIRQSDFVDKMSAHLWIRSPAVEGTLRRAIDRYTKFLGLLGRGKKFIVVPTLDVDLAWHTNQCFSGMGYASTMQAKVGRFINHDDTIAKDTLGDGFAETRKLWRICYGKEYKICGCWDCEALTSEIEKASSPPDFEKIATKVQQDVMFHRVAEVQRRKKEPLPAVHCHN